MGVRSLLAAAIIVVCTSTAGAAAADDRVILESDAGARVDALGEGSDVRVFVFVRRDCPVANRYAPELGRLQRSLAGSAAHDTAPVRIWLVYVDRDDTAAAIAAHQREYALPLPWLIDRTHRLATLAGATVTPEAAVYSPYRDGRRRLLYRGRIDDRVIDIGRVRPAATRHELREAIEAAAHGRIPREAGGPAVGCYIADAR